MDIPVVESLNNSDNVDGINTTRSSAGKDGDECMFLDIEGARVQGERPLGQRYTYWFGGKCCCHEFPNWERHNLCRDGGNGERVGSVAEELVHKREDDA